MIKNNKLQNGEKLQNGGKVVASGGFGCIFSPELKCENSVQDVRNTNKVSKLMITKYAEDEYNKIETFKDILKVIPNYDNYFLLSDFQLCKPNKLTKEDLKDYGKKCKALKKKDITAKNINENLDKIMTINMPNGGVDIEQFILNQMGTISSINTTYIINLNNSLIDLLVNGIIPMNKLNVYHCDIKDSNVLVKIEGQEQEQEQEPVLRTRLIDWGLSIILDNEKGIPKNLYRRPFQFNVPFSSVLFNKDFTKLYSHFLELNPEPDYYQIREFVINYIFIWNDIRGPGHLSAINDIVRKLTIKDLYSIKKENIKDHFVEYDFTYYYIIEYLSKILAKYTKNGTFDIMTYFETVFIKNLDIWGFTMIYIVLYEYLYPFFYELNHSQMEFISKIKYIIIHFLYESPTEIIDVASLVDELTNLNTIIDRFNSNQPSNKLEYFSQVDETIGGFTKKEIKKRTKTITKKKTKKVLTKRKSNTKKIR